jgi:hypothetical protein
MANFRPTNRELAEHEAKLAARRAKTVATGKKPGGKPPQPPVEGPLPTDQINRTDEPKSGSWIDHQGN